MPEHTGEATILDAQTTLPTDGETMFATDEHLADRLRHAETVATDLEYRAGVLKRELASLRKLAYPESGAP